MRQHSLLVLSKILLLQELEVFAEVVGLVAEAFFDVHKPDCAIKEAVVNGLLNQECYIIYLNIIEEVENIKLTLTGGYLY